jgi:hypothetical protein
VFGPRAPREWNQGADRIACMRAGCEYCRFVLTGELGVLLPSMRVLLVARA